MHEGGLEAVSRPAIDCRYHGEQELISVGDAEPQCFVCWDRARVCKCGCGRSLSGRHRRVESWDERCRQRVYRRKLKGAAEAVGLPASFSLKTLESATSTADRRGDGHASPGKPRRPCAKPRKPSLRISYRKAVVEVAEGLLRRGAIDPPTEAAAFAVAHSFLRPVLSDRQRAAL